MKLINYLHYYIGCDYWTNNSQGNLNAKTLPDVIDMCERGKGVQLHLRRLEDMTEEEAIAVHREATKTPFLPANKDEYDVTYIKDKRDVCSIQVVDLRMPKMYTNINIDGDVLVYIHEQNNNPKICERVANQNHITHYLLQNHFDLFGLVDAGLAIDAKTIKS
jgi:hypothetical protein